MALRLIKAVGCIILVSLAGLAGVGAGRSAQGEGERCSFFPGSHDADINGTSECQSGLVCYPAFNTTLYPYDRCCPLDRTLPSNVPACYEPNLMPDGSTPEAGPTDGSTETPPTDAPPKDAPAKDAPGKDSLVGDVQKSDAPAADGKPAADTSTD